MEDLYTVYYLARANKRRSEDAVIFETNMERNIADLCKAINDRTYRANANYAFVSTRPKPREVFGCELESRLIQWYVVWRILPYIEQKLTNRTFNNRVGMGTESAVECLRKDIKQVSANYTKDAYVIQWDLKGYFPNANCDIASAQLKKVVLDYYEGEDKEDILWMIDIAIHANPQRHCYLKSPKAMWELIEEGKSIMNKDAGVGGAIGFLIWQIAMNLYLDDIDHWAVDEMGLHYTRFVDDTVIVVENKDAALLLMPLFREMYTKFGVTMHPKKFYCQHYGKGVKFLGTYIKFDRTYCQRRNLRSAMARIWYLNKLRNKRLHMEHFLASVNSYCGLLKSRCEYKNIKRLVAAVSPEWMQCVTFNEDRLCFEAREGYKHKNIINYKFNRK